MLLGHPSTDQYRTSGRSFLLLNEWGCNLCALLASERLLAVKSNREQWNISGFVSWGRRQLPLGRKKQGSSWKKEKRLTAGKEQILLERTRDLSGIQHAVRFCAYVYVHVHPGKLKTLFPKGSEKPLPFNLWRKGCQFLWCAGSELVAWWLQDGLWMMWCVQGQPRRSQRGGPGAGLGPTCCCCFCHHAENCSRFGLLAFWVGTIPVLLLKCSDLHISG